MAFPTPLWTTTIHTTTTSRPGTRDGPDAPVPTPHPLPTKEKESSGGFFHRERKNSGYSRRSSISQRRRGSSAAATTDSVVTDAAVPPALPFYALAAAAKVASREDRDDADSRSSPVVPQSADGFGSKMLSRTATGTSAGGMPITPGGPLSGGYWQQQEAQTMHQGVQDLANKRINFLDYLRKAHEGRRYWFNTYLFDKPDLNRMPFFDPRKLPRKSTNYLLLGVSLPVLVDLYSSTPSEFLRSMNLLFTEFESFQTLHNDSSSTRARLPNMFRRPGVKSRRSTSNADVHPLDDFPGAPSAANTSVSTPSVMNFAASESDLLPGEEYTHLLTPALPFEPDYFETFATLCDVLIDCYTRILELMPSARECSPQLAEMFTKVDAKIKKTVFQGVVKEFEDNSRASLKTEVASIGKVVLGGLM